MGTAGEVQVAVITEAQAETIDRAAGMILVFRDHLNSAAVGRHEVRASPGFHVDPDDAELQRRMDDDFFTRLRANGERA